MNYSQNNEEAIIRNYFQGKPPGCFLDLGANDGITLSNTYALAEEGWSGVCVEASPKAFERLQKTHAVNKRVNCFNLAVGCCYEFVTLYESGELLGTGDVALVSSVNKSELKRWPSVPFTEVIVQGADVKSIIYLSPFHTFDFISIDIEGSELSILPQINFAELRTSLLCVEFNGKNKPAFDKILLPQGFILIHQNAENLMYACSQNR